MTQINHQSPPAMPPDCRGAVVSRPRRTDAIGGALACAFEAGPMVPADMLDQLRKLGLTN